MSQLRDMVRMVRREVRMHYGDVPLDKVWYVLQVREHYDARWETVLVAEWDDITPGERDEISQNIAVRP